MKETIKQLEKGCGKWYPLLPLPSKEPVLVGATCGDNRLHEKGDEPNLCPICKAKLQTLKDVCEEIDKEIENYKKLNKMFPKNQTFVDMWTSLFALQLNLQGEEDNENL